jgi:hypothetical protein
LWLGALLLPVVSFGDGRSADRTAVVAGAAAASGSVRRIIEDRPASNVFTSVYLGHLSSYGILFCRLSELHTA